MKFVSNLFIVLILFLSSQNTVAQQNQKGEIKKVITLFFKALQNGDTIMIKKTISNELKLQTIFKNKNKEPILKNESVSKFLKMVSLKKPEDIWEEKLLSYHIKIDDNMANVWTPYRFYLNNDFSHCGVNSFQLFFDGKNWKIIYLIDTRRKQNCKNIN